MVISLKEIRREPLGLNKLRAMLPNDSKAVLYSSLAKDKRSRQAIFKGIRSLVVLYENEKGIGSFSYLVRTVLSILARWDVALATK